MKMTRFLSLTLALLLTLALFTTALAATNQDGSIANIPLSAKLIPNVSVSNDPVWFLEYDDSVNFGAMAVDVDGNVKAVWDPQKGTYTLTSAPVKGKVVAMAELRITNRSNFDVSYGAEITGAGANVFWLDDSNGTLGRLGNKRIVVNLDWNGNTISLEGVELSATMQITFNQSGNLYPVG